MPKLKVKNRVSDSPDFLKKLQDIQKEVSKQKLTNRLKGSVASA